jgi:hypothetical protein
MQVNQKHEWILAIFAAIIIPAFIVYGALLLCR